MVTPGRDAGGEGSVEGAWENFGGEVEGRGRIGLERTSKNRAQAMPATRQLQRWRPVEPPWLLGAPELRCFALVPVPAALPRIE